MEQSLTARTAAKALYEAYNQHLPEDVAALYAPDGRHEEIAQGQVREGREAIAGGLRSFFEAFPDIHWEEREAVVGENAVAVAYTLTGTLQADLGPIPARGQRLEIRGVHVLWMASDEFIERTEDYWDMATFQRQMSADAGSGGTPRE